MISTVDTLERPTADRVLQALPGYSIAHFACHGVSSTNPTNSHHLLLKESISRSHDDLCTEEADELRAKDIAPLKLPAARLAYLSACSTANSTPSELIDEMTHIVSSFHIAGLPHVIGTLWPAEDGSRFLSHSQQHTKCRNILPYCDYGINETEAFTTDVQGTIHSLRSLISIKPYSSFAFYHPKLFLLTRRRAVILRVHLPLILVDCFLWVDVWRPKLVSLR